MKTILILLGTGVVVSVAVLYVRGQKLNRKSIGEFCFLPGDPKTKYVSPMHREFCNPGFFETVKRGLPLDWQPGLMMTAKAIENQYFALKK